MTVYKKEEKVAITVNLNDISKKGFIVMLTSFALAMAVAFGYLAAVNGLDTIVLYVIIGLTAILGVSGFASAIAEVIANL